MPGWGKPAAVLVALALAAGCGDSGGRPPQRPAPGPVATDPPPVTSGRPDVRKAPARRKAPAAREATVIAVGDIADCGRDSDETTAQLVRRIPGTLLTLGDTVYPDGTADQFARCYAPAWGRFRDRTRPVPGNHDYRTDDGRPYYDYFGRRAGTPGKGWYSFELAGWRLIALNSNCDAVGCGKGSEQVRWLRAELAARPARCTLAYYHHPRFSSGFEHGSDDDVAAIWAALVAGGADLVLSGHEHNYERFGPLDAAGRPDPDGTRQFVVGTGGAPGYAFGDPLPGSEARDDDTVGVLQLTLRDGGYRWRFVPVGAGGFTDAGSGTCR